MMRRRRLFARLLCSMLCVGVLTAVVVSLIDDRSLASAASQLLERELRGQAEVLEQAAKDALGGGMDATALQARLRSAAAGREVRYTVMSVDGERVRVLADSSADPTALDDHAHRPEIVAAARAGVGVARRYSTSINGEMIYVAKPVRDQAGALRGYVRAAQPSRAFERDLGAGRRQLWIAALLGAVTAGLLAWWFARAAVRPIAHLQGVANAMARGENARAVVEHDDEFGELARALNTMADRLEERVEEMRGERAKLSAILGGMVEGVAAFDERERVLHLNGAAADILGTGDDCVGKPLTELTRIPEICELVAATLSSGAKASREVAVRKGIEARVLQLEAAPLRDRDDDVNGCVLVLHDVTELRRLEGVRRDFVANVSHELKTPLTAIKGMVDTMIDDAEMAAEVARFDHNLAIMLGEGRHLTGLIDNVLELAALESGDLPLTLSPTAVADVVDRAATPHLGSISLKGLAFIRDIPNDFPLLRCDRDRLVFVLGQLLENAVKFTSKGSITCRARREGDMAVIAVKDTGQGIPQDMREVVFEKFRQLGDATTGKMPGLGIGLAASRAVIEHHGGVISIAGQSDGGVTVSFTIPLADAAA